MKGKRQFPDDILAVLREAKGLRIRAGTSQHRFIGIWVVVVKDHFRFADNTPGASSLA